MGWLDNQEELEKGGGVNEKDQSSDEITLNVKLPGAKDFILMNRNCIKRKYNDDLGSPILIIIDEAAELLQPTGVKSEEGKETDKIKTEIESIIQSITQLGRSSCIHCLIATQRNGTKIINGTIQNNCIGEEVEVDGS